MTAVKGPFLFTSDRWQDSFIDKAKQAGCGAVALQLGKHPGDAPWKIIDVGLQVIGWGTCSVDTTETAFYIGASGASVWMPQAENTAEFDLLIACLRKGIPNGLSVEPVMTSGGMEPPGNPTPEEKVAERKRRIELLNSFGITKVWVEVYAQDADKHSQPNLGYVNYMCDFFVSQYGFAEAHPVLGLWTVDDTHAWARNPYQVSNYNLSRHGRTFGAWRAEQMADERYTEMAAVPPFKFPSGLSTKFVRAHITSTAQDWENGQNPRGSKPLTRISICKRIAGSEFTQEEWNRMAPTIKALLDLEHQ